MEEKAKIAASENPDELSSEDEGRPPLHKLYSADTLVPLDERKSLDISEKLSKRNAAISRKVGSPEKLLDFTLRLNDLKDSSWSLIKAGTKLEIGNVVELVDNSFLMIEKINQFGEVPGIPQLWGWPFRRIDVLKGWLPTTCHENEVVMFCEALTGKMSPEKFLVAAWVHEIRRLRNLFIPATASEGLPIKDWAAETGEKDPLDLVCRWKYEAALNEKSMTKAQEGTRAQEVRSVREGNKMLQMKALLSLTREEIANMKRQLQSETDSSLSRPDNPSDTLSTLDITTEGQNRAIKRPPSPLGLQISDNPPARKRSMLGNGKAADSCLKFADAFCGAGGMSRAAKMAGFEICFGFDNNEAAMEAYRQNFVSAEAYLLEATDFIQRYDGIEASKDIDVLHISPPCQPWSTQNFDRDSKNEKNQKNIEALKYISDLVKKVKPRIVTLEETDRLLSHRPDIFATIVESFTSIGYQIRWNVIKMLKYGLPQNRQRLIMIASR